MAPPPPATPPSGGSGGGVHRLGCSGSAVLLDELRPLVRQLLYDGQGTPDLAFVQLGTQRCGGGGSAAPALCLPYRSPCPRPAPPLHPPTRPPTPTPGAASWAVAWPGLEGGEGQGRCLRNVS